MKVALLTGGKDAPYVQGLLREMGAAGVQVAVVGGDEIAEAARHGRAEFHNLIGAQDRGAGRFVTAWRVLRYYARLLVFTARTDAQLFHVLWFYKCPYLERTFLTTCFKLLRKKLIFTAHIVDEQARDARRVTLAQQLSLRFLYRIVDHIIVHTDEARCELGNRFRVPPHKVTTVPFGINDITPVSSATRSEARRRLGLDADHRVLLFFGRIAPYKGLEDVIRALAEVVVRDRRFTLIIAGRPADTDGERHWMRLAALVDQLGLGAHVRAEIRHIGDDEIGLLFRAADLCMLPYRRTYQSGVLALSYAQGIPVVAADVSHFRSDVLEGETGWLHRPEDVAGVAERILGHFASDLYIHLESRSREIQRYGSERFSWKRHVESTLLAYERLA